ncbi:MAG: Asp23/Gls24 family envelope stress response protein [Coriobacteriia bacterium]|nr:Asp23/Gls24 family envelope stress response protein [Coriobacteriia bacterium]
MATELRLDGLDVAPGVVETIVQLAAEAVDGVAAVGNSPLGKISKSAKTVEVCLDGDGSFVVTLHMTASYGRPLRQLGACVQEAVGDALLSQTGHAASRVDVFIDGIQFPEQ